MTNEKMNGTEKAPNPSTATPLGNLSDQELLMQFHSDNWKKLSPKRRAYALQEVENRRAQADGRPAIMLYFLPLESGVSGAHGVTEDGTEVILIDIHHVEGEGKLGLSNGFSALETVLHEGRHAFHFHAIDGEFPDVPEEQLIDWAAVMAEFGGLYTDEDPFYWLQSIEMDARRFARREMENLQDMFISMGMPDIELLEHVVHMYLVEDCVIEEVRKYLTLEDVDQYEQMVLDHLKETRPELDLTDLHPFEHVRFILQHPEIEDSFDMLECLDNLADEKLGIRAEEDLNRFKTSPLNRFNGADLNRIKR